MTNSNLKKFSYHDFKLKFEQERVKQDTLSVCESYNVDFSKSTIKPLHDFKSVFKSIFDPKQYDIFIANIGEMANNLVYYTEYSFFSDTNKAVVTRHFLVGSDKRLYEINIENLNLINLQIAFKSTDISSFERDGLFYIQCPNNLMVYFRQGSSPILMMDYCDTISLEFFQDLTVFAVRNQKYDIYYSTERTFDNYTSDLSYFSNLKLESTNGEVLSINKFGSGLYVVQQYAISKLTYSNGELKVSSLTPISSKIINESISVLKDNLVFLTLSGICIFDGLNLKTYFEDKLSDLSLKSNSFCVFNEKYYAVSKTKTYDVIFEFDIQNESFTIYNIGSVERIYTIKNVTNYKLLAVVSKGEKYEFYQLDETQLSTFTKYIKFNKMIFDNSITKILSSIQVIAKNSFLLKINSDYSSKEIAISGDTQLRNLGLQGNYFQFEIASEDNFEIESIMLTFETYSEKL